MLKVDDHLTRFFAWKWHLFVLLPGLFLLISLLYYAFCFSSRSYAEVYQGSASWLSDYCGFASLGQGIAFFVLVILLLAFAIALLVVLKKAGRLNGRKWGIFFAFLLATSSFSLTFALKANANFGHIDWCLWNSYADGSGNSSAGHWGVILDIFRHGTLADFPKDSSGNYLFNNQYYQNKLWHYLMAYFMRFNGLFIHVGDAITADASANGFAFTETENALMETIRIPVSFIGIWTAIALVRLLEKLGAHDNVEAVAMGLFACTPIFTMLPSELNNDSLSFLLTILALYWTLEWHQHFSWHAIILIAFDLGLAMAAKFNAGVMALPIAGVFLYELIRLYQKKEAGFAGAFKEHPYRNFWLQIASFVVIVFPLGLFFTVIQNKLYGIPYFYVWYYGVEARNYVSPEVYNPFIRFFIYPAPDMFFSIFPKFFRSGSTYPYNDPWGGQDFNIWTGFFKSALFNSGDLDSYPSAKTPLLMTGAITLYVLAFLLSIFGLVYGVFFLVRLFRGKRRSALTFRFFLLLGIAVTEIISYIYFNFAYPFSCTSNCRYILEFFFPLYLFWATGLHRAKDFCSLKMKYHRQKSTK
jgi:hypothetical protein